MIDIIIPAYNANDVIQGTLFSIESQTIKDMCKIYIINDGSDFDYSNEIDKFKESLNITEIKLSVNSGPGVARQIGLDKSDSEYIVFMDSDDELYDCHSLENILNTIEEGNFDIVASNMVEIEDDNVYEYMVGFDVLHSKIYRRKYIEDNKIIFPALYHSEDLSFNDLFMMFNPKIGYCESTCYVYKRRENSLTTNEEYYAKEHIKYYIESKLKTIEKAKEYKAKPYEIGKLLIFSFAYLYYYFCNNMSDSTIKYIYCLIPYYNEYSKFVSEDEKYDLVSFWIERLERYPLKISYEDFIFICEKNYYLENNI